MKTPNTVLTWWKIRRTEVENKISPSSPDGMHDDRIQNGISWNAGLNFPEMQPPNWLNEKMHFPYEDAAT